MTPRPDPTTRHDSTDAVRAALRGPRRVLVLLAVALLLSAAAVVAIPASKTTMREHLLGDSQPLTARVVAVERDGLCVGAGPSSTRWRFTLTWTEDGQERTEDVERCNREFDVGERADVWPTSTTPYTDSPTAMRIVIASLFGAFVALAFFFLWLARRMRPRDAPG